MRADDPPASGPGRVGPRCGRPRDLPRLFVSICEEMGLSLMRSAPPPNQGETRLLVRAVRRRGKNHRAGDLMPVHLGSMPASVAAVLARRPLAPGDVSIVNDPFHGGSHLPDITLVSAVIRGRARPVLSCGLPRPSFRRRRHAGGSMPLASEIYREGLILPPLPLVRAGAPTASFSKRFSRTCELRGSARRTSRPSSRLSARVNEASAAWWSSITGESSCEGGEP